MGSINWNGQEQKIEGTIIEDLINGFWKVSEDVYYDHLAKLQDEKRYVDPTPDNLTWYSDKGSDSDQIHYKSH